MSQTGDDSIFAPYSSRRLATPSHPRHNSDNSLGARARLWRKGWDASPFRRRVIIVSGSLIRFDNPILCSSWGQLAFGWDDKLNMMRETTKLQTLWMKTCITNSNHNCGDTLAEFQRRGVVINNYTLTNSMDLNKLKLFLSHLSCIICVFRLI